MRQIVLFLLCLNCLVVVHTDYSLLVVILCNLFIWWPYMIATILGLNRSLHVCIYQFIFLFSYYFYIVLIDLHTK